MRIWSLHPKYLDAKGLVALWRETLLAKNVLGGNTKGYKNHPQLIRFRKTDNPIDAINQYLLGVFDEATTRGYVFDKNKIDENFTKIKITVTIGQIEFEKNHLLKKLQTRDPSRVEFLLRADINLHPMFAAKEGDIEMWEKI